MQLRPILKKLFNVVLLFSLIYFIYFIFCIPKTLFKDPYSKILLDQEQQLLNARIAQDGQWRFPQPDSINDKFSQAIILFEDKRFYRHPGVDLMAFAQAFRQNIQAKKIVRGGSTLTMQVIRLSRKGKKRTILQKIIESTMALRLELSHSKKDIISLYAAHAPFGGNVVGLGAASWRYYGKDPELLSWSEASALAVLPNAPSLIHPGRNRTQLRNKRNRLLQSLFDHQIIDDIELELALEEPLPGKPKRLPREAPHLLERLIKLNPGQSRFQSTIKGDLQAKTNQLLAFHSLALKENEIHNAAVLILDVKKNEVISYLGNIPNTGLNHGEYVDIIQAARSTGSIMKPFLYTAAQFEGRILPQSMLPDIPLQLGGFRPKNFHLSFDGMVRADQALIRSLNVPFAFLLRKQGVSNFHHYLQKLKLKSINKNADHYGLPLVLGGAESSLWELCNAYAYMSRALGQYYLENGKYDSHGLKRADYMPVKVKTIKWTEKAPVFDAGSIWLCFKSMQKLERPNSLGEWQKFSSSRKVAWKTGTSNGHKDAWAIGVTPDYVVGVWVGNADGEGRSGLTGIQAAAPVLFDVFDQLEKRSWFEKPFDELREKEVCIATGFLAGPHCPKDTSWVGQYAERSEVCPYHQLVHTDREKRKRVHLDCSTSQEMISSSWLVLPPANAHFFSIRHPSYRELPSWKDGCKESKQKAMQFIYPLGETNIYLPFDMLGEKSSTVFEVAHQKPSTIVFWHLDDHFLGQTQNFHEMEIVSTPGPHEIVLVDEDGNEIRKRFNLVSSTQ